MILFYILYSSIANAELAAHSCLLLQECIKSRSIHNHILHSYTIVEPLFTDYAYDPHFDICSDVLQNIHLLLRDNKLLLTNDKSDYSLFVSLFTWMRGLISCSNYITVRMSLSVWIDVFLYNRFWLKFWLIHWMLAFWNCLWIMNRTFMLSWIYCVHLITL